MQTQDVSPLCTWQVVQDAERHPEEPGADRACAAAVGALSALVHAPAEPRTSAKAKTYWPLARSLQGPKDAEQSSGPLRAGLKLLQEVGAAGSAALPCNHDFPCLLRQGGLRTVHTKCTQSN